METGVYEIRKHGQAMSRIENEGWAARNTSLHFKFVFRAAPPSFSMGRTPPGIRIRKVLPSLYLYQHSWRTFLIRMPGSCGLPSSNPPIPSPANPFSQIKTISPSPPFSWPPGNYKSVLPLHVPWASCLSRRPPESPNRNRW